MNIKKIGEALGETSFLCADCKKRYIPIKEPVCMKCGKALEEEISEYCFDCEKVRFSFAANRSVFSYDEAIRDAMYDLKYNHIKRNGEFFGEAIVNYLGTWILSLEVDAVVPIPLHKKREKARGYNQSVIIAEVICKRLKLPLEEKILFRTEKTRPQKELSREQRKINVKNAFKMCQNEIQYDRVLLIDDIYTTGATLDAAARILKAAGVQRIYCITACIGKGY